MARMVTMLFPMVLLFFFREKVFGPILLTVWAIFPVVAFTGNKPKYANNRKCAENELFHVSAVHILSQQESKASLWCNFTGSIKIVFLTGLTRFTGFSSEMKPEVGLLQLKFHTNDSLEGPTRSL